MDKVTAWRVWQLLDDGLSLYKIDQQEGIPRRSGQRVKTVRDRTIIGEDIAEIANATRWSEKRVRQHQIWWEELAEQQRGVDARAENDLIQERRKLHLGDLDRASRYVKDYLEQVAGRIPDNLLPKWEPQHMDLRYTNALFSHLAGTELGQAIESGIAEGPRGPRRTAAVVAGESLRDVLPLHLFPGRCEYCP